MTVRILTGDARGLLTTLPDRSVHCCVTSPPYFGLRSYLPDGHPDKALEMGLEQTPDEFIAAMVDVFRDVRRVLRDDGTLWLNIGDSYAGSRCGPQGGLGEMANRSLSSQRERRAENGNHSARPGAKPKDMLGIPWMLAFALRADGWYLRRDIIWHKLNPMPESVRDRPTTAHEYLFLLSKSQSYFYDADAVMEPSSPDTHARASRGRSDSHKYADGGPCNQTIAKRSPSAGRAPGVTPKSAASGSGIRANESWHAATVEVLPMRNKRSVWSTVSEPYSGAHFATFPPALIEPCILAGCPRGGVVLDPFFGAGTTGLVAQRLGRDCIGIELNPDSVAMARDRIRAGLGRVECDLPEVGRSGPLFDAMEAAE